jgi:Outer membrane protein beta-barrel domain
MKNLSKIILGIALATISSTQAQKLRVGIQGGVSLSNPNLESVSGIKNDVKGTLNPYGGLVFQVDLGLLKFRPSLNYSQYNVENVFQEIVPPLIPGDPSTVINGETVVKTQNIDIPLDLVFPLKLKSGNSILFYAAPTITVGLKAEETTTFNPSSGGASVETTSDLDYGTDDFEIKKTDWGTRFGIGYELKNGIQLNLGYKLGLTDINNAGPSQKNNQVTLTASYFLF